MKVLFAIKIETGGVYIFLVPGDEDEREWISAYSKKECKKCQIVVDGEEHAIDVVAFEWATEQELLLKTVMFVFRKSGKGAEGVAFCNQIKARVKIEIASGGGSDLN